MQCVRLPNCTHCTQQVIYNLLLPVCIDNDMLRNTTGLLEHGKNRKQTVQNEICLFFGGESVALVMSMQSVGWCT